MEALQVIQNKIYEIRGQRVMLDRDLAVMYEVETRRINEVVKRNMKRFPSDFMFQLTNQEFENLISQIATSSWGGVRKMPYAFTEQGCSMLSVVLRNSNAVQIGRAIMEAFIGLRNAQSEPLQPEDTVADHFADVRKMVPALIGKSETVIGERQVIQNKIYEIRGQRVMLDFDLAAMYQVDTKRLKEQVKRNIERFDGADFMFELTRDECNVLKICSRSQIATLNKGRGSNIKYAPWAFTEQGVAMLSSVLRSKSAIEVNRGIMRAFVSMRNYLSRQSALPESTDFLRKQLLALSRNQAAMAVRLRQLEIEREQNFGEAPTDTAPKRTPSKFLSETIHVGIYSERALIIYNNDKNDCRLLKSIGARFNPWLTWQGERMAGWILPKTHIDSLCGLLPEMLRHKLKFANETYS